MALYRQKNEVVDAVQVTPALLKLKRGCTRHDGEFTEVREGDLIYCADRVIIFARQGMSGAAMIGDFIVTNGHGEIYPVHWAAFIERFEKVDEDGDQPVCFADRYR